MSIFCIHLFFLFFFFNATATTEIYTLSLHDALPIYGERPEHQLARQVGRGVEDVRGERSEEHTSELQSRPHLVCRLLLEKKKKTKTRDETYNKTIELEHIKSIIPRNTITERSLQCCS